MKKQPNTTVAKLRKIIGKTQEQFAVMLGASKDTIISIENGRNRLTQQMARRIEVATGAIADYLEENTGEVLTYHRENGKKVIVPYIRQHFDHHRRVAVGTLDDNQISRDKMAETMFDLTKDRIEVLLVAATRAGLKGKDRFPAVLQSLDEWIDRTYYDFNLANEVDVVLRERTYQKGKDTFRVGFVRASIAEGNPYNFKFKNSNKLKDSDMVKVNFEHYSKWTEPESIFPRPKRSNKTSKKMRNWDFSGLWPDATDRLR